MSDHALMSAVLVLLCAVPSIADDGEDACSIALNRIENGEYELLPPDGATVPMGASVVMVLDSAPAECGIAASFTLIEEGEEIASERVPVTSPNNAIRWRPAALEEVGRYRVILALGQEAVVETRFTVEALVADPPGPGPGLSPQFAEADFLRFRGGRWEVTVTAQPRWADEDDLGTVELLLDGVVWGTSATRDAERPLIGTPIPVDEPERDGAELCVSTRFVGVDGSHGDLTESCLPARQRRIGGCSAVEANVAWGGLALGALLAAFRIARRRRSGNPVQCRYEGVDG